MAERPGVDGQDNDKIHRRQLERRGIVLGLVKDVASEWMHAEINNQTKTGFEKKLSLSKSKNLQVCHRLNIYALFKDGYIQTSSLCSYLLQKYHRQSF